jgi:hypothetical protein
MLCRRLGPREDDRLQRRIRLLDPRSASWLERLAPHQHGVEALRAKGQAHGRTNVGRQRLWQLLELRSDVIALHGEKVELPGRTGDEAIRAGGHVVDELTHW